VDAENALAELDHQVSPFSMWPETPGAGSSASLVLAGLDELHVNNLAVLPDAASGRRVGALARVLEAGATWASRHPWRCGIRTMRRGGSTAGSGL
jgi:hypothetical protein